MDENPNSVQCLPFVIMFLVNGKRCSTILTAAMYSRNRGFLTTNTFSTSFVKKQNKNIPVHTYLDESVLSTFIVMPSLYLNECTFLISIRQRLNVEHDMWSSRQIFAVFLLSVDIIDKRCDLRKSTQCDLSSANHWV